MLLNYLKQIETSFNSSSSFSSSSPLMEEEVYCRYEEEHSQRQTQLRVQSEHDPEQGHVKRPRRGEARARRPSRPGG